jgi:ABC-type lipoprotein release transport system permease subunit
VGKKPDHHLLALIFLLLLVAVVGVAVTVAGVVVLVGIETQLEHQVAGRQQNQH